MIKINILSQNKDFAEDLGAQINLVLKDAEISFDIPTSSTSLLIVDEKNDNLKKISQENKELPIVLLSSTEETSDYADIVIQKPLKLNKFLTSLENNTLLPKVRRKECIVFKEYHLYPVKKEIYSEKNNETTKLTEKEVDILKFLYQISPDSASKEDLLEKVWDYSAEATTHTVETHIYRLRQKVEKKEGSQLIITENNGYRLNI